MTFVPFSTGTFRHGYVVSKSKRFLPVGTMDSGQLFDCAKHCAKKSHRYINLLYKRSTVSFGNLNPKILANCSSFHRTVTVRHRALHLSSIIFRSFAKISSLLRGHFHYPLIVKRMPTLFFTDERAEEGQLDSRTISLLIANPLCHAFTALNYFYRVTSCPNFHLVHSFTSFTILPQLSLRATAGGNPGVGRRRAIGNFASQKSPRQY